MTEEIRLRVYDEISDRSSQRVSAVYPLECARSIAGDFDSSSKGRGYPVSALLDMDRLRAFFEMAENQMPRVLARERLDPGTVDLACGLTDVSGFVWLFCLPHGSLVMVLTLETEGDLGDVIGVTEDLHHRDVKISGEPLWNGCRKVLDSVRDDFAEHALGLDTYQLVMPRKRDQDILTGAPQQPAAYSEIASIVYRYRRLYAERSSRVCFPEETNRGEGVAATGPYVGVLSGAQGYIENAALVSAVQFVGALNLLRRIRIEADGELNRMRKIVTNSTSNLSVQRAVLGEMEERLGRLEIELSVGVEAPEKSGSLMPSLRALDFHQALFASGDVAGEAKAVSQVLARLANAIGSGGSALGALENAKAERRRSVTTLAVTVLTLIAIPAGLLFGFFGMTATEVSSDRSFLDFAHYLGFYVALLAILTIAISIAAVSAIAFVLRDSRNRDQLEDIMK